MWLKFFLIWRYFRFWSLVSKLEMQFFHTDLKMVSFDQWTLKMLQICGIEAPENMPRCINNCYNLESFWKNWHASFNKWLVRCDLQFLSHISMNMMQFHYFSIMTKNRRYMYIPLGGSQRKLLNVWVIFTFVAIWHDLEWYLNLPFSRFFFPAAFFLYH